MPDTTNQLTVPAGGCDCVCHVGGAYRPACSVPGGCGSIGCDGTGRLPGTSPAEESPGCALCNRRNPRPDRVCARCRQRVLDWIADLPSLWRRLDVAQVRTEQAGERVSSSAPHSTAPADIDAVSLRAASPQRLAAAGQPGGPGWTPDGADLPIPAWVDGWVRSWRRRHDHHRPALTAARDTPSGPVAEPPGPPPGSPTPEGKPQPPARPGPDVDTEGLAAYVAAVRQYRRDLAAWWERQRRDRAAAGGRIVLGLGAALPPAARPDDPVDEQVTLRYGAPRVFQLGAGCGYLAAWFDRACDDPARHPDIAAFIIGLRDLVRRAQAALGERSDDVYLGRCPEAIYNRAEGREEVCGAKLFQDPFVDVVCCRRCRTEWPKNKLLFLAARSYETWPDDFPGRAAWDAAR